MAEILAGGNAVREALLAARRHFERVLIADGVHERGPIGEITHLCRQARVPLFSVARQELDRLSGSVKHQGVLAEASPYPYASPEEMLTLARSRGEEPFLLAFDGLQDPQNVGSLLRTAEAVGVHGVLLPERRTVQVTPAVVRASAGAAEHLLVAQITNLVRTLRDLKEQRVWVVGVEQHARSQDYRTQDLNLPLVLVLGSEGEGLRRLVSETCDWLIEIPMRGRVNSLNVAVAGALALYQAWHTRQGAVPE
jgi:23S rRNA (guanosine2251-2'-O)-methyltransferase